MLIQFFFKNISGPHWKKSKRLMEPAFGHSSLRSFVSVFQEKTDVLVKVLEKNIGKPTFPVYDYIKNCSFDIITSKKNKCFILFLKRDLVNHILLIFVEAMCDIELNAQMENVEILEDADVIMMYATSRIYSIWHHSDLIYKLTKVGKDFFRRLKSLKAYVDEVIAEKKKYIKESSQILRGI